MENKERMRCSLCNRERRPGGKPYQKLSVQGELLGYLCKECGERIKEAYNPTIKLELRLNKDIIGHLTLGATKSLREEFEQ